MGMEDRDWYRAEYGQRRARAERSADESWHTERQRPPIPLKLRPQPRALTRQTISFALIVGMLVLTVTRYSFLDQIPVQVGDLLHHTFENDPIETIPFPVNGYTVLRFRPSPTGTAPLTLQTSATDPAANYVITVRGWSTNDLVATTYLNANSVATLSLPVGDYRLSFATGRRWGGERMLFGSSTTVQQARFPISLVAYPDYIMGRVVYLMPTSNPNLPTDRITSAQFTD